MSASADSSDNISPPPSEATDTSPSSPALSSPPPPSTMNTPPTPSPKTNKRKSPTSKPPTPKKPAKSAANGPASWAPEHEKFILVAKAAGKPVAQITTELNEEFTIDRTTKAVARKLQNLGVKNYQWTTELEDTLKTVVREYKAQKNGPHVVVAGMFRGKGGEAADVKSEAIQVKLKAMEAEGVIEKL